MLGKRSRSFIGRLSEILVSGSRPSLLDGPFDTFTLDRSDNSTNRNFDLGHQGVGLGIVVAPSSSAGGGKYFVCSPRGHGTSQSEEEEEEDYTYVTFHGPRVSFTMVYYDQIEKERSLLCSCQRCGKKLHGQDIYMYRGEKGFCSADCRSAQITSDERSEQCRLDIAADAWSYPSTSILAVL